MPPEEAKLLIEASRGDRVAFAELFAGCETDLYRFTRHLAREPDVADELYQETWLRAARQLARSRPEQLPADFRKWLFAVAANLYRDELRRRKVRRRVDGGSRDDDRAGIDERVAGAGCDVAEKVALRDGLDRALAVLTERQRAAFLLVHVEGFKLREAATALGMAEGTVKSTLHRAAERMREELQEFRERKREE